MLGPSLVVPAWTGLGVRVQGSIAVRFEPHPYTQDNLGAWPGATEGETTQEPGGDRAFYEGILGRRNQMCSPSPKTGRSKPQDSFLLHKSQLPEQTKTCKQQPPSGKMTLLVTSNPGIV